MSEQKTWFYGRMTPNGWSNINMKKFAQLILSSQLFSLSIAPLTQLFQWHVSMMS